MSYRALSSIEYKIWKSLEIYEENVEFNKKRVEN